MIKISDTINKDLEFWILKAHYLRSKEEYVAAILADLRVVDILENNGINVEEYFKGE